METQETVELPEIDGLSDPLSFFSSLANLPVDDLLDDHPTAITSFSSSQPQEIESICVTN